MREIIISTDICKDVLIPRYWLERGKGYMRKIAENTGPHQMMGNFHRKEYPVSGFSNQKRYELLSLKWKSSCRL